MKITLKNQILSLVILALTHIACTVSVPCNGSSTARHTLHISLRDHNGAVINDFVISLPLNDTMTPVIPEWPQNSNVSDDRSAGSSDELTTVNSELAVTKSPTYLTDDDTDNLPLIMTDDELLATISSNLRAFEAHGGGKLVFRGSLHREFAVMGRHILCNYLSRQSGDRDIRCRIVSSDSSHPSFQESKHSVSSVKPLSPDAYLRFMKKHNTQKINYNLV